MKNHFLFIALFVVVLASCVSGGSNDKVSSSEAISSEDSSAPSSSKTEISMSSFSEFHDHTFNNDTWEFDSERHWHPSTCGHDVTTNPIAHSFKDEVIKPTYESDGYTIYTCSVCGYSYKADISDKLEHNYSPKWTFDSETHWHACQDEGYDSLKSLEDIHRYREKVTKPTAEAGGYTTYSCIVCGYSYVDDYLPKLAYTITWKNYDGTILETDAEVPYGTIPTYDGDIPVKGKDIQYSYTFSGWSPEIVEATRNATYTAQFDASINEYEVTWKNYDGTVLKTDKVGYGTIPSYDGSMPTKSGNVLHYYIFSEWSPEAVKVTGDVTYTACFTENNIFAFELSSDGNEYTVTQLIPDEIAEAIIPAYINDIPVTCVADYAFKGKDVKSVVVPEGITSIGKWAFSRCSLSSISMPETLLTIGEGAFSYCSNLKSVVVPDSVVSVGEAVFSDCTMLDTISLPFIGASISSSENMEYIFTTYSHDGSHIPSSLRKIILSASCKSLTENDFRGCTNLTAIEINGKDTEISGRPFSNCLTLKTLVLGPNITKISDYAFYGLGMLTNVIMSDSVVSIGTSAFQGCGFTSIRLSESLTTLGKNAFCATNLTSIEFPNLLEKISSYSFYECVNLSTIKFGVSIKLIGGDAFKGCTSLNSLTIPASVRTISENAFSGCSSLESLDFEEGVTTIEDGAFSYCAITSLTLPDSLTSLGSTFSSNGVFNHCANLKTAKMGAGHRDLSYRLFEGCSSLTTISYANMIRSYALTNCTSLTSFVIDGENVLIGSYAFSGCSSLGSLVISGSVSSVGSKAFNGCDSLTELSFSEGLTYLGDGAFSGASALRKISFKGLFSPTPFNISCFDNCSSLEEIEVEVSDEWYTVDGVLFRVNEVIRCPEGKKTECIEIPDGVDMARGEAFKNCAGIESIVLPADFVSYSAFSDCVGLTKVFYKGTDTSQSPFSTSETDKSLLSSKLYYYSETEPSKEGQYWHYVEGVPMVWQL